MRFLSSRAAIFACATLLGGIGRARANPLAIAVFEDNGACNSDVSHSPLITGFVESPATDAKAPRKRLGPVAQARALCEAHEDPKRCFVYPVDLIENDRINTHLVIVAHEGTCRDQTPKLTFGFGTGASADEAKAHAAKDLSRRDWTWKRSDGFDVREIIPLAPPPPAPSVTVVCTSRGLDGESVEKEMTAQVRAILSSSLEVKAIEVKVGGLRRVIRVTRAPKRARAREMLEAAAARTFKLGFGRSGLV